MINLNVREQMRRNIITLVRALLIEKQEFRLVLWNNNDWNEALPESIMNRFPLQLVLDIKGDTLESSYIDEDDVVLVAAFEEGSRFDKVLDMSEVVAVLDLDGQPLQVNNFVPEEIKADAVRSKVETKEDLINSLVEGGVPKENAERSIKAFAKNNPDKFDILTK